MHDSLHSGKHPTDEQLFDLLSRSAQPSIDDEPVAAHVARCSACRAFVDAATVGTVDAALLTERLPADRATRMHAALAAEFAATYGADSAQPSTKRRRNQTLDAEAGTRFRDGASRGWKHWAVPAIAFAVVAALAGISLTQMQSDSLTHAPRPTAQAPQASSTPRPEARQQPSQMGGAAATDSVTPSYDMGQAQPQPNPVEPTSQLLESNRICVIAFASAEQPLPDSRPITELRHLPLDMVIVCG